MTLDASGAGRHRVGKSPSTEFYSATDAVAINTSVDTHLERPARAVLVGTAGNLVVTFAGKPKSEQVTLNEVPSGVIPIQVTSIWSGSTATNVTALY